MDTHYLHLLHSHSCFCPLDSSCSQGACTASINCSVFPSIQMEKAACSTKALVILPGSCTVLLATAVCCDITFSGISWRRNHCLGEKTVWFTSCCLVAAASLSTRRIILVRLSVCDFPLNSLLSSNSIPAASAAQTRS